jgi:hypothetical protein
MAYLAVRTWRQATRRRLVAGFGGCCAVCGLEDDEVVYDFHHVDPSVKEYGLSSKIMSWDKIVAEAKKCVMVCVICHRKVHKGTAVVPDDAKQFDDRLAIDPRPPLPEKRPRRQRDWSTGSRKGIKMPRSWSRQKKCATDINGS